MRPQVIPIICPGRAEADCIGVTITIGFIIQFSRGTIGLSMWFLPAIFQPRWGFMSDVIQASVDGAIPTNDKRVACNGGGGPLGHPQVWLTLGTDGEIVCPYCSRHYVLVDEEDNE